MPLNRRAGLIVLSTAGAARFILKDMSEDLLTNGRVADLGDGAGLVHRNGVEIVVHLLRKEFEPEQQERDLLEISTF